MSLSLPLPHAIVAVGLAFVGAVFVLGYVVGRAHERSRFQAIQRIARIASEADLRWSRGDG